MYMRRYNGGDRYAPSERDPAYAGRSAAPAAAPRERSPNGAAYDRAPAAGGADPYGRAPGGPDRSALLASELSCPQKVPRESIPGYFWDFESKGLCRCNFYCVWF